MNPTPKLLNACIVLFIVCAPTVAAEAQDSERAGQILCPKPSTAQGEDPPAGATSSGGYYAEVYLAGAGPRAELEPCTMRDILPALVALWVAPSDDAEASAADSADSDPQANPK